MAALCLKDDLPISVRGQGTSIFAVFLKLYLVSGSTIKFLRGSMVVPL